MRIAFALFAAGLMAGVPAFAQNTSVVTKISSGSASDLKSGVMTINGNNIPVFRVSGGDIVADVIPAKPGQPMHPGPVRHTPLVMHVDAEGLIALKSAVDALLSGQPKPFDATIVYNGRKLTLTGARLSLLNLPSCRDGKVTGGQINLALQVETIKVATEAETAQSTPGKFKSCIVTLDGMPANGIRTAAPGPAFGIPVKEKSIGDLRDYGDTDPDVDTDFLAARDIGLIENKDAPGLADWARNDLQKGIGEARGLQIAYTTAAGSTILVKYGKALAKQATLGLEPDTRVILALENPSITKP